MALLFCICTKRVIHAHIYTEWRECIIFPCIIFARLFQVPVFDDKGCECNYIRAFFIYIAQRHCF